MALHDVGLQGKPPSPQVSHIPQRFCILFLRLICTVCIMSVWSVGSKFNQVWLGE